MDLLFIIWNAIVVYDMMKYMETRLAAGVTFRALQFGNVTVNGDLAGVITTDVNDDNVSGSSENSIGNVTINGNILDGGYIESSATIGNVNVTGTVSHILVAPSVALGSGTVSLAAGIITTLGRTGASAAIGNVTFGGTVYMTAAESLITANRSASATTTGIGTISGTSLTINTGTSSLAIIGSLGGSISPTQGIGGLDFVAPVSLTGGAGGIVSSLSIGDVRLRSLTLNTNAANGIVASGSAGSIGNITITGGDLTLTSGKITATTSIGNISVPNFGSAVIGQAIAAGTNIGTISVAGGNLTTTAAITAGGNGSGNIGGITVNGGNLSIDGNITATGGNIGDISVRNSTATAVVGVASSVAIQATSNATTLLGGAIGNISVTSTGTGSTGNLTFGKGALTGSVLGRTVGNVAVDAGNLIFTNAGSKILATTTATDPWLNTSIGDVTVTGGGIQGRPATSNSKRTRLAMYRSPVAPPRRLCCPM
jgi:hypothetical protein